MSPLWKNPREKKRGYFMQVVGDREGRQGIFMG
jgi:hypothetical protein